MPRPMTVRSANVDRVKELAALGDVHWKEDRKTVDTYITIFDAIKQDGDAMGQFGDAATLLRDVAGDALAQFVRERHIFIEGWGDRMTADLGDVAALLIFDWMEK